MSNGKRFALGALVLVAFILFGMLALLPAPQMANAAPAPAITPVAAEDPLTADAPALVKFVDGVAISADTQYCVDLREFRTIDLEFVVDQGTVNTTTVTLEHTNGAAGDSNVTNTTGQTVVSANAADADDLNRFDLFGVYTCVDIDVANTNPITWTVYGLARK